MKCPICKTGELMVCYLYQYTHLHKITKKGKLSQKYTISDNGTTEQAILCCENGCRANDLLWELDEDYNFTIETTKRW